MQCMCIYHILTDSMKHCTTDSSLRDGLFHEYKKHGKVISVLISVEHSEERAATVTFKKLVASTAMYRFSIPVSSARCEDAIKACEASKGKKFFGRSIAVILHEGNGR